MKKVLFIADDIRLNTGVGIQARKLLKGLAKTGKYEVVELGCASNHKDLTPRKEDNVLKEEMDLNLVYQYPEEYAYVMNFVIDKLLKSKEQKKWTKKNPA